MNNLVFTILTGIGATIVIDLWSLVRKPLFGTPPPNYGAVGRWIAYMTKGQFRHESIAASAPLRGEKIIGWTAHYLIGIAFAALLIVTFGTGWLHNPTIGPALTVGIATVAAPFLFMQPGMGLGIAATRTKNPTSARIQSLITHTLFGFGLYISGWGLRYFIS